LFGLEMDGEKWGGGGGGDVLPCSIDKLRGRKK
jgi:hypothetical protein